MNLVEQAALAKAINDLHGCNAKLKEIVIVKETFRDSVVWEGAVHVFDVDHPNTKVCYAWSSPVEGSDRRRFYTVLKIPPVNSPQDAVRAAIVSDHKGDRT